jgi:UDP-N-acetylmuramoyl-L-alanyl-D-glutamate--2,6-diaminopimelate ligase
MLAERLGSVVRGEEGVRVTGVSHDSRQVSAGDLFVAMKGDHFDGHDYIEEAVSRGAVAVICERMVDQPIPQVLVCNGRAALGSVSAEVYGHPSHGLRLVGITGTNGKTTVMHMIESVARAAGHKTGLIGTMGARIGNRVLPTVLTTPEASDIQRRLASMRTMGVDTAIMEVSSHGLALQRVDELRFALAVFTNLGHDHLDFHGTQEDYYRSKEQLFSPDLSEEAVVWTDDEWGRRLVAGCRIPFTTVGIRSDAEIKGEMVSHSLSEVVMKCQVGGTSFILETPMGGIHNGTNALLAAAAALRLGFSPAEVSDGIGALSPVDGRFEVVAESPVAVVVDYAHTPGAIRSVIRAGRATAEGRLIVVIGAGGDRDRSKRGEMARAASLADRVMVTSDNPRSEDPFQIMADLAVGLEGEEFGMEVDRRQAINTAVGWAQPGDVVLILGKGHERYQEVGGERIPFDDRAFARQALGMKGADQTETGR